MTGHDHLHRRHARNAFPNPFAWASAAANALASPFAEANPVQTMVSVVYITASPTFDGPIGGYTTLGAAPSTTTEAPEPTTTPDPQPDNSSAVVADSSSAPEKHASSSANVDTSLATSTDMPSSIAKPSTSVASSIALLAATTGISSSHTTAKVSATSAAASASASASSSSGGMSAAGKAGMAIGIILLLGAVLSLVLFCFKKRRDAAKHDRLDDEKTPDMFAGAGRQASTRTTATAPRLSLRPVTQFLPYLGGEKRQSRGNALAMTAAPMSAQSEKRSAWERPMNGQDANRNNPFGNHAETIDATNANGPAVVQGMGPGGEILAGAVAAGAAAGLARGASKRGNGPKPMDFTKNGPFKGPPSPAPTEFSETAEFPGTPAQTNTGAAIAAAGGPPNSTVHRVQLDFKPSMEDELELRAGQLIRLLHEYDDGWVSCFLFFSPFFTIDHAKTLRLFAFVSIALNKALFPEHVYQLVQSSLAHSKTVLEAHHLQACESHNNNPAQCHQP